MIIPVYFHQDGSFYAMTLRPNKVNHLQTTLAEMIRIRCKTVFSPSFIYLTAQKSHGRLIKVAQAQFLKIKTPA